MITAQAIPTLPPASDNGVSPLDAKRIINRISQEHNMEESLASATFQGTLDFLRMASQHRGRKFVPSQLIDKGWHTFLLYTKAYRNFCRSLGVEYIDHEPSDNGVDIPRGGYANTISFMQQLGIHFNPELWGDVAHADCTPDPCTCCSESLNTELVN